MSRLFSPPAVEAVAASAATEQKAPRHKSSGRSELRNGVTSGARTHDLLGHNQVLCQLSYGHHTTFVQPALLTAVIGQGASSGTWIRTTIRGSKVPCPAIRRSPNAAPDAVRGKTWCRSPDLNWGHRNFQSRALPTELLRHGQRLTGALIKLAYATEASMPYARCHLLVARERAMRLELTTFSLARRRSTAELRPHRQSITMDGSSSAGAWALRRWTRSDSNRRSPPCKGGAFPLGHGPAVSGKLRPSYL